MESTGKICSDHLRVTTVRISFAKTKHTCTTAMYPAAARIQHSNSKHHVQTIRLICNCRMMKSMDDRPMRDDQTSEPAFPPVIPPGSMFHIDSQRRASGRFYCTLLP